VVLKYIPNTTQADWQTKRLYTIAQNKYRKENYSQVVALYSTSLATHWDYSYSSACGSHVSPVLFQLNNTHTHTHTTALARTRRMSQYQKKHSPTRLHLSWSSVIPYLLQLHLVLRSTQQVIQLFWAVKQKWIIDLLQSSFQQLLLQYHAWN